ncbi:MAG: ATP-binding protein, partial [Candidatus Roizmanbacteria bacterium]|nr:ATP-binding protein [Candidatus Roizmanbacteria bacterium]
VWLILTIVSVGTIASVFVYQQLEQTLLSNKKQNIVLENSNKVKQIKLGLDNISLFAKMLGTRTRVVEYLQNPTSARKTELEGILDAYQKEDSRYLSIYLMDTTGLTRISTDRSFVGVNYGFRPYFKEAIKGNPSVDVALGKTTNKLGYYFSHPVEDATGKVLGVLAVKLEPSALFLDLIDEFKKKDIKVMMTNLQGIILYSTETNRELKSMGALPQQYQQELKTYNPFQGAAITSIWYDDVESAINAYSKPILIDMYDKIDKKNELITVNRVENYPFYFIAENELDSIISQVADIARLFGIGVFGSALFCVVITSLAIRNLLYPLKELKKHTQLIEKGDFSQTTPLQTGDELEELSHILIQMQYSLKDQYESLEKRVKERTVEADATVEEMEQQKKELEKGRTAILNILEDERELEVELKKEKEGVEKKIVERTLELANEKSRLTASISSLPQAFLIVSTEKVIVAQNSRLDEFFGKSNDIWTLKKVNSCLSDMFNLEEYVETVMKEKKILQEKEVLAGKLYVSVYIAPVVSLMEDNTEKVIGAIITITNITEERNLSRSKDEFFSIASHELRTPLTAIRGNTSMILDYYVKDLLNPELKVMIEDTHEASVRLIGIVNDFLDMSRLELGKMDYKKENILLSPIVSKIKSELITSILKKGTTIVDEIKEDILVLGDSGKVKEIFLNLIGNALKFTENGTITISAHPEGANIQIDIADTGRGIALTNQTLLFHKFQQAGSSITTRDGAKGTGLGLYISRLMAEGMGGTLDLKKSVEGEGSIFCLTLPKGS